VDSSPTQRVPGGSWRATDHPARDSVESPAKIRNANQLPPRAPRDRFFKSRDSLLIPGMTWRFPGFPAPASLLTTDPLG
jgi:hypothetical protein